MLENMFRYQKVFEYCNTLTKRINKHWKNKYKYEKNQCYREKRTMSLIKVMQKHCFMYHDVRIFVKAMNFVWVSMKIPLNKRIDIIETIKYICSLDQIGKLIKNIWIYWYKNQNLVEISGYNLILG